MGRKIIPKVFRQIFQSVRGLIRDRLDKFRGSLKNPLFYLSYFRTVLSKNRRKFLVILTGVVVFGIILVSNSNEEETICWSKKDPGFNVQSPFLAQGEQKKEPPDLYLIQENTLAAASPSVIVTPQILGVFTEAIPEDEEKWSGEQKELIEYIVKSGDTLSGIADKFNISLNTIFWANELDKNSVIKPGQKLLILPVSGVLHYVKTGDNLSEISQTYKGKIEDIVAFNEISDKKIYPGDIIIIPDGKMPAKPSPAQYTAPSIPLTPSYFLCPIPLSNGVCRITQKLHYYNAVDFSTAGFSCGQPVFAAASGEVLKIKYGYNFGAGNYIRILHPNGLITHYGHLSKILVSVGQKISRGDIIGLIGYSGYTIPLGSAGCHLHFGVYSVDGRPPLNPFAK